MIVQLLARYWAKVDRLDDDRCWNWKGARTAGGYGQIGSGATKHGKVQRVLATHVALAIAGRQRPSAEHMALHRCDNPLCVNPDHLFWGTAAENHADMVAKGRAPYQKSSALLGDQRRYNNAKLTVDDVYYIRRSEMTTVALADELGVTNQCISNVRLGRTWKHLK